MTDCGHVGPGLLQPVGKSLDKFCHFAFATGCSEVFFFIVSQRDDDLDVFRQMEDNVGVVAVRPRVAPRMDKWVTFEFGGLF